MDQSQTLQTNQSDANLAPLHVVVGLGQSGLASIHYLFNEGYSVAVTDSSPNPTLASELPDEVDIRRFGELDAELMLRASRVIISPGISLEHPAVAEVMRRGVPVVSDIQLFHEALSHSHREVAIVAITGSNAKSTVTTLVGEMAKQAGVAVGVGGNIGTPALNLLTNSEMTLAVLELSSFQLESVNNLNAQVATVLNMSPDHLDRHGDMTNYQALKHKIFQGAKSVVINRDDEQTIPNSQLYTVSQVRTIGSDQPSDDHYGLIKEADGQVYLAKGTQKLVNTNDLKIKGQHNQLNALHALALGELAGLPLDSMLDTLQQFTGLAHRCQFIQTVNQVDYFNDSKGTNIGSTMAAIKGLGESYRSTDDKAKLVLILGGQSKGQDFGEMVALINRFVGSLYFIGEDAQLIQEQLISNGLSDSIRKQQIQTLDKAVTDIHEHINNSDNTIKAVLLSPACASFDQFDSYVKRGERFIELVKTLAS